MIAEGIRANDLVVRHDGGIFADSTRFGGSPSQVWYISPQGQKRVVDSGLNFANGITLSPDQSLLYVADYGSHWVYSYQVDPDGTLAYKQRLLPSPHARHGRLGRCRWHPGRSRRPTLCHDIDGHSGLRSARPGELHHPHAQRQGR